jgi:hypothetical protein
VKLVNIQRNPDPGWEDTSILILWNSIWPDTTFGQAECDGTYGYIWLNDNFMDPALTAELQDVVRHEMGHIFDLTHTGTGDSFGFTNEMATLSTCVGGTQRVMGQDDGGALHHKVDSAANPATTANFTFEDGATPLWWGIYGVGTIETDSPFRGDRYLKWTPSSSTDYVYQTMNYAHSASQTIDVMLAMKRVYGASSGTITVEIWRRAVYYPAGPQCSWPTGRNQNVRDPAPGPWVVVANSSGSWSPGTSWAVDDSADVTVQYSTEHAWDIRFRVYSNVSIGGDLMPVGLDQVRLRNTN